jgi:hypothetical protein
MGIKIIKEKKATDYTFIDDGPNLEKSINRQHNRKVERLSDLVRQFQIGYLRRFTPSALSHRCRGAAAISKHIILKRFGLTRRKYC